MKVIEEKNEIIIPQSKRRQEGEEIQQAREIEHAEADDKIKPKYTTNYIKCKQSKYINSNNSKLLSDLTKYYL